MKLHVQASKALHGTLRIPGSKSQSIRALFFASLARGRSTLHFLPESEDVSAALDVCKDLGARIESAPCHQNCIHVEGDGAPLHPLKTSLWSDNSGITTRFTLPLLALTAGSPLMHLDANEQMRKRPIEDLLKNLSDLGCHIESTTWPLAIQGPLLGGSTKVSGLTSQFISALLIAGVYAKKDLDLHVENLNERPYLNLTLDWLQSQNIQFTHTREGAMDDFHLTAGQSYSPIEYYVPGDYSSASTFLAAGALFDGEIRLTGLDPKDLQGDRRLLSILAEMGAELSISADSIRVHKASLKGLDIDANDIPDLVPTLAVLGTQASGVTRIFNVPQARFKETDRLHSMTMGLQAMGAHIEELPDGLTVYPSRLHSAKVHGFNDHRTIMALALAGLLAEGETVIDTAEGLSKTYPFFADHLKSLTATCHLI